MGVHATTNGKSTSAGERYPAGWRRVDGEPAGGVLVLGDHGLRLEGRAAGAATAESVPYAAIDGIRVGRNPVDRVEGRSSIVVEQRNRPDLLIAPRGIGLVAEVADLLSALTASASARTSALVVVAPLRKGAAAKARELVAAGPPFDPAELGLTDHHVFLTEREAIFTLAGTGVQSLLENGFRDPLVWRTLIGWRRLLAGRPRVATAIYAWPAP